MREVQLPESLSSLVNTLHVVQFVWQGIPLQVPKFSVYSIVNRPVFDRTFFRNSRRMAMLKLGRYNIPVIDPFKGHIECEPPHVVIISHCRDNLFGLYAYPADHIEEDLHLPTDHRSVTRIIKDFV